MQGGDDALRKARHATAALELHWSRPGACLAANGNLGFARPASTISGMRLVNVTPLTVALALAVVTLLTLL
jgi:hypothetical protein